MKTTLITPTPASSPSRPRLRSWAAIAAGILLAGLIAFVIIVAIKWPFRYRIVHPFLQNVFASQIHILHYRRTYLPHPGFIAEGITLSRNSAPDIPPIGSAQRLMVQGRWIDLLLLRNRLQFIDVEGLHVVLPPAGTRANREDFPPGSSSQFAGPSTLLDHLIFHDAILDIMRIDGSRYTFPIHYLAIGDLQRHQTVDYNLDMESPIPAGHIRSTGTFGPLVPRNLAATPLSGKFTYSPVDLSSVSSLHGILHATGQFHGTLADIEASGQASTSDFAVGQGRPTAITNTASFSVNGLNADIHIHSLDTRSGRTTIHTTGDLTGSPKTTNLDLTVLNGRAQDILHPFLRHASPITGDVRVHTHAYVAPPAPGRPFLQRLVLKGAFDIPDQRITDPSTQQKLTAFSQRAQSHPEPPDPADPDEASSQVLSRLAGPVVVRNAIASSPRLTFLVPGASVNLAGTFNLRNQAVDLTGNLHMQTGISHAVTGFKSTLFAPLNPFFRKKGVTSFPIAITGLPGNYKISQNLFHNK